MTTQPLTASELESKVTELTQRIGVAVLEGADIGDMAIELVDLRAKLSSAKATENAQAINDAKSNLIAGIKALVEGSKIESLLGTKVVGLAYTVTFPASDQPNVEPAYAVHVNPKRVGKASEKSTTPKNGTRGRKTFTVDGTDYKAREFVDKFAVGEERTHSYFNAWASKLAEGTIVPRMAKEGKTVTVK